jgi:glutaredoxin
VTTLTLIGRDGCHLCDDARDVVTGVLANFPTVTLTEVSIDDDEALHAEYWEQIPVLLIDGKVHNFWRIDPIRLSTKLKELS